MNFSELEANALRYLSQGYMPCESSLASLIQSCLREIDAANSFRFVYAEYTEPLDFLKKEPYVSFLSGAEGYFLIACTLGVEIEKRLKQLSVSDLLRMVVYDACANAYLEYKAEEQKRIVFGNSSYTFCSGYAGSSLEDIRFIFKELKPERIGITLSEDCLMIPQKSIAGVVAKGINPQMQCSGCVKFLDCAFRKDGKRCFQSVKN